MRLLRLVTALLALMPATAWAEGAWTGSAFVADPTKPLGPNDLNSAQAYTIVQALAALAAGSATVRPGQLAIGTAIPAKVMYGGFPVSASVPRIMLVDGTPSAPRTDTGYKTPALYLERYTNNSSTATTADWGNPQKNAAALIEVVAGAAEKGEVNAIAGRVFTSTADPGGAQPLTAASFVAQSNAPAGQPNRQVFGLNVVAASSTGSPPPNLVGIEVDIIPPSTLPNSLRPGQVGAINHTGVWVQSAGGTGIIANTGFLATASASGSGWLNGAVFDADFYAYGAFIRNTLNAPSGKGLRVETTWAASGGRVIEAFVGANEVFHIDGVGGLLASGTINVGGGAIEIGSASSTADAYIDFHSSGGTGRDYDARIVSFGGNTASDGKAGLAINSAYVVLAGCPTSASGLPTGTLWCNGNVINRVP